PAVLRGDPGRIRQVLLNLLTNAIKFTESGEVVLSASLAEADDSYASVRFEVRDTGIGIPQSGTLQIFEPFIQADGSATRKHGGTGLGLSISKRLVELMGGQIGVESVEGEGSTFWFVMPLEKPAKRATITPTRKVFQNVKLLIVDGPNESAKIVHKYVSSWGIRCDIAATGEDAVHMMRQEAAAGVPYDLAVIDFQLTYSDALALAQSISRYNDLSCTKLVLTSCFDDIRLAQDALHSGFSAVLVKPVRQMRLYDCLVNLLTQAEPIGEPDLTDESAELKGTPTITNGTHSHGGGGRQSAGTETVGTASLQPADLGTPGSSSRHLNPQHKGMDTPLILVVEDNPVNQKVVMLQLSELGYRAHAVANGRECLEALARTHYFLILMDCQMPEMDGFAATAAIRDKETLTGGHIPIVALTAHAMIEDKYKCLNAGMDDYISKPVKPKALKEILDRYMGHNEEMPPPSAMEPRAKPAPPQSTKPPIDMLSLRQSFGADSASELVSTFLGSTKFMIDEIAHAITTRNVNQIEEAARELVRSSANMTASELSSIGSDLEKASLDKNWNAVDTSYRALRSAFDRLTEFVASS
ncbi:MAG TPA: response regulator, partial [Candidatus Obscuribacterales bacterium]